MKMLKALALSATGLMASSQAFAHVGHQASESGFISGILHPLTGLDHLLVLLAVGIIAATLKGRQRLMVPAAFVALMAAGFVIAYAGLQGLSGGTIETLISVSVIAALALVVALNSGLKLFSAPGVGAASAWLLTAFAIAHGFAHGLEVPAASSAVNFAIGFVMASSIVVTLSYLTAKHIGLNKVAIS